MTLFMFFRYLHVGAGFLALLLFAVPILTKKGGPAHNRAGWIYVWAMGAVSVSALYMGVYRVFLDASADRDTVSYSWFLIFIAVLSSASAWYGIRVLRFKNRKTVHARAADLVVSALLLLSGVAIGGYGYSVSSPLITYFPLLGVFLGSIQLAYWLRKPAQKMHWYFEHLSGMIACCISTVTAFAVFGAPRLLNIPATSLLLWLAPSVVLVPVLLGFTVYYKRKFGVR